MPANKANALRTYHVLVRRNADGFVWQIRYGRHAQHVAESDVSFSTIEQAEAAGRTALDHLQSRSETLP
ncbi:hypothetical protein P7D22_06575 [Lichenihabitans sp. Uapishka_5]|uniref:hypothetical protein n=1 Tax=Lichenihabitans sp. Uapishka_5 TaxID=3037302 RepID=UPI0029E82323|nr:hypothetical protein [Lichenihabitans sp. Uapishka_5]MDX7950842.1 hypothetical protein [Lichenihabitans sp. Uapishka_5]